MLWLAQQESPLSDRAWVAPLDAGPAMGAMEAWEAMEAFMALVALGAMEALVAVDTVAGAEATGTSAAAAGPAKHSTTAVPGGSRALEKPQQVPT